MSEFELNEQLDRLEAHQMILATFGQRLQHAADTLLKCSQTMETASASLESALLYAIRDGKYPPEPGKNGKL
jgi:hypothetical protein